MLTKPVFIGMPIVQNIYKFSMGLVSYENYSF
jgi:hypothetical protein